MWIQCWIFPGRTEKLVLLIVERALIVGQEPVMCSQSSSELVVKSCCHCGQKELLTERVDGLKPPEVTTGPPEPNLLCHLSG